MVTLVHRPLSAIQDVSFIGEFCLSYLPLCPDRIKCLVINFVVNEYCYNVCNAIFAHNKLTVDRFD